MGKDDQELKPEMELTPQDRARLKQIYREKLLLILKAKGIKPKKKETMH